MNQQVQRVRELIDDVLSYELDTLIGRPEWGTINFNAAEEDLKRISGIASHLKILPVEQLTEPAIRDIVQEMTSTLETLKKVDQFSIEVSSPTQQRDQIAEDIHARAEALYTVASPWIPFLAYLRGDVDTNIKALTKSVEDARELVDAAKGDIAARSDEIDKIIIRAREASAAAGAAVFTKDFQDESEQLGSRSESWLRATGILAIGAILVALVILYTPIAGGSTAEVVAQSTSRLAILAITVGAALWCGRVYKAFLHQATLNRHRSLSLQTFQAFSHAAAEDSTRDAVLLEATRAIFGPGATGLLDVQQESQRSLQVVEIARRLMDGKE